MSKGSTGQINASSASTLPGRIRGRFGAYVLLFVVDAAAVTNGQVPMVTRRVFSSGEISASPVLGLFSVLDDRVSAGEPRTLKQIEALNALLALPDDERPGS
jgi:hypothetical protein